MKVSHVNEMRNLDHRATREYGIPQEILMENAGQAAYYAISKEVGINNKDFVVFCGVGNNGGDGLVVARKIFSGGGNVNVFILGVRSKYKGAARQNFEIVEKMQMEVIDLQDIASARSAVQSSDAIIDAIFGTGLEREVTGIYKDVIDVINAGQKKIFSLDIPSGVHGDTGQVMGTAVKADFTITFGLPKIGNLIDPGYGQCGRLYVTHISFPPALQTTEELKIAVNDPKPLPERRNDSNRDDYGKTLFVAGSSNSRAASYLSALSFLKSGGGLPCITVPGDISSLMVGLGNQAMFMPQKTSASGMISPENKQQLLQMSENVDMVVIGPGFSSSEETQMLARELYAEVEKPLLVNRDGIKAVADDPECIRRRKAPVILSLQAEEMADLEKVEMDHILHDKIDVLQTIAQKLDAIAVLKESQSFVAYPDKSMLIHINGNSGKVAPGSDAILAGIIPAMCGLGFSVGDAAGMGVFIYGSAIDLAIKEKGKDGLTTNDIIDQLPGLLKDFREDFNSIREKFDHHLCVI